MGASPNDSIELPHCHAHRLSGFFMSCMLTAEPAKLLVLHPPGLFLFILGGGIVSAFALSAFEGNDLSHACSKIYTP